MFEQRKCPLCGKKELMMFNPNECYFIFNIHPQWICQNCGSAYNQEEINQTLKGTKISKKLFFDIIFKAARELFHNQNLSKNQQEKIEYIYCEKIKTFYKEVAESQAELFYETACSIQEYEFFNNVDTNEEKKEIE